jgi:hypothetical protein
MPHPMSLFPLLGFRAPSNLRRRKAKEGKGLLERHGDYLIRTERRELALLRTLHGVVFTKIKWCPPPRGTVPTLSSEGTPRALHDFASYSENMHRIVLHFEHFYCNEGNTFCNPSGCLHQVWISAGGHYRLERSYNAPTGE